MSLINTGKGYQPIKLKQQKKKKLERTKYDKILVAVAYEEQPEILCCQNGSPSCFRTEYNGSLWNGDARTAAVIASIWTVVSSIIITTFYCSLLNKLSSDRMELEELYYGVQVSYLAVVSTQISLLSLGALLYIAILRERTDWVALWMVGVLSLTPLEGICTVYSNILREHVIKRFDTQSKVEFSIFVARVVSNVLSMAGVYKFYRNIQSGISYRQDELISL